VPHSGTEATPVAMPTPTMLQKIRASQVPDQVVKKVAHLEVVVG